MMESFYRHERALELANIINLYWSDHGYSAGARPFILSTDKDGSPMWSVTSNMVNGLPTMRERVMT